MADEEKEITLKFIEDYRSFPQLWDQNNKLYTNKIKRRDGLQVLATKYNMDTDGVKKKIKSLRSYFSKEHQKVIKKKSGSDTEEIYHSPWFAYKHLLFTADSVAPRDSREIRAEEAKMPMPAAERQRKYIEKLKRENPDKYEEKRKKHLQKVKERKKKVDQHKSQNGNMEEIWLENSSSIPSPQSPVASSPLSENKNTGLFENTCSILENNHSFNENLAQAQIWTNKLQRLDPIQRLYAEKRINDILFEAELGNLSRSCIVKRAPDE